MAHKPANTKVDGPLTHADYYYLEALLRHNQFKQVEVGGQDAVGRL
ncbi:hypothetical protein [Hymenobacter glacieicola]|nr:hypothetical protein [Hymenobacter glacieicola]